MRGRGEGGQQNSCCQPKEGSSYCYFSNTHRKPKTKYREILTHTGCTEMERECRGWYQKEKGHKKVTKRGSGHG